MKNFVNVDINGLKFDVNLDHIAFIKHAPNGETVCLFMVQGSKLRLHVKEFEPIRIAMKNDPFEGITK